MDIATAIFGCLLSKWHLVTRLLGLGRLVELEGREPVSVLRGVSRITAGSFGYGAPWTDYSGEVVF